MENTQKLTQLSSRSQERHLVRKRTAQKDTIIDITGDSYVNSNFPYRWSPSSLTFNMYFYLILYLYITRITINNNAPHLKSPKNYGLFCHMVGWLVVSDFNGPLRQYFSLYRAVFQRGRKRRERTDESKNVQTPPPTGTFCKCSRPLPYCNPNCRAPRHWKFTQHHRTTRPPHCHMVATLICLRLIMFLYFQIYTPLILAAYTDILYLLSIVLISILQKRCFYQVYKSMKVLENTRMGNAQEPRQRYQRQIKKSNSYSRSV